ncbi:MAG: RnfABCDGE type electron transport complex subunit D [Oscillospiraceae bacterium]|nr:RnfABCDGE type electron transport complex subunit D [Oscillospiraceae bacterium]
MDKLLVSPSPHLHGGASTQRIMLDVIIALTPVSIASVLLFGYRAALMITCCVLSCVAAEWLFRRLLRRSDTVADLSAAVTGLLLALNMPSGAPLWLAPIGAAAAIIVVKQLFGGIGHNFVNPALTARVVLFISFPGLMSRWTVPCALDGVTGASPLTILKTAADAVTGATGSGAATLPPLGEMFLGIRGGMLGETCIVALLLGFVWLLVRRIISPAVPLTYLAVTGGLFLLTTGSAETTLYQLMSGGLLLGAVFMATDYATSPVTSWGKIIFGAGCGLITFAIRQFGALPEGVSFAIIIMNILCPHIERLTMPKAFGKQP